MDDLPVRPTLASHVMVDIVPGQGVMLTGERGSHIFWGGTYERLVPLLQGDRTSAEIVDAMEASDEVAHTYYALMTLARHGFLVEGDRLQHPRFQPFLDTVGRRAAAGPLASLPISVRAPVEEIAGSWRDGLGNAGLHVVDEGASKFEVWVVDDYRNGVLSEWNDAALKAGVPWMLCRSGGTVLWVGPIFIPGETACWTCLRDRLRRNRPIDTFLERRRSAGEPVTPLVEGPGSVSTAVGLAATQIARFLATRGQGVACELIALDTLEPVLRRHPVTRRPQCPSCGDPDLYPKRLRRPVRPGSSPKAFTADGGHRTVTPTTTVGRLTSLVDPLTGVVSELTRISTDDPSMHVYAAGFNHARPSDDLRDLRAGLRRHNSGKGWSDEQARASALGEAVERYSGVFQGDEPRRAARFVDLGDEAIHPGGCLLYSDRQYRGGVKDREAGVLQRDRVPVRFDPEREVEWTPVWSLTSQRHRLLPTALLYYGYPIDPDHVFCVADSNGNASGNTMEEAIVQGFLELVERDSVALWWYNRIPRPAVDLSAIRDPAMDRLLTAYETRDREVWVLDLRSDLGIPVFASITRRRSGAEEILLGLGAHLDPFVALRRAMSEMTQMLVSVEAATDRSNMDSILRRWLADARVEDKPYLGPSGRRTSAIAEMTYAGHDDLRDDIEHCRKVVEEKGHEVLVLDQTRPDVDFPVVKVIVPGLRHFRPRFARGRLYEAPVEAGWVERASTEADMNPIPFFL